MQEATQTLADRLMQARHAQFVAREAEVALFNEALAAAHLPYSLLHISGPGGIGKSALLHEFEYQCGRHGVTAVSLDGRDLEPHPEAFARALAERLGADAEGIADCVTAVNGHAERLVLLLDRYEEIEALDRWLRHTFLPQLNGNVLFVLASRNALAPQWETDPGWRSLLRRRSLRNLTREDGIAFMAQRQIPDDQHQAIWRFTQGHPLALSLAADLFAQRPNIDFHPDAAPDMVQQLVSRFMEVVPSPAHRAALEACAIVRLMTEPLLAHMLATENAHELFTWLHTLSFIETSANGLSPNHVTREVMVANVRWRNPDWYRELHNRARSYYSERLHQTHGATQREVLINYIFMHRNNKVVRPFYEQLRAQRRLGGALASPLREQEWPLLQAQVAEHEGDASAALAAYWFARQPEGITVFRDEESQPAGFLHQLALEKSTDADRERDPAVRAAWAYLQAHAPLRQNETATLFRFWMARDTYQTISPVQSMIFVNMVRHYLVTPNLAHSFVPCADAQMWMPIFMYADLPRLPAADFEIDGRSYGVFGHDWRAVPPMAWLDLLAERETSPDPASVSRPAVVAPLLVLSRDAFDTAVHDALRHYAHQTELVENPLLQSSLVANGSDAGADEKVDRLRTVVQEAVASLADAPKERKFHRVLHHAYIQPAATHEQAAELIDVPYGTFRRHLKRGVTLVSDILWQQEVDE